MSDYQQRNIQILKDLVWFETKLKAMGIGLYTSASTVESFMIIQWYLKRAQVCIGTEMFQR